MASPFPRSSSLAGQGRIVVARLPNNSSALESISYQYPLKLISPSPSGDNGAVLVFLLSYGGGLVGGDQVHLAIDVRERAKLAVVTQGHTKVFQSLAPDIVTRQSLTVHLGHAASMCLLPDPVQPFADSVYEQTQIFTLARRASLCLLDWVTQGRLARGEDWDFWKWKGRNEVWAEGEAQGPEGRRLLVRDSVILDGVSRLEQLQGLRESMQGHAVFGTLILRGPAAAPVGQFFLDEFAALPRVGARDFDDKKAKDESPLGQWRSARHAMESESNVLWTAARVRGCVVVKFGAATVEAGRTWIGAMLVWEGSIEKVFGEQALMCVR